MTKSVSGLGKVEPIYCEVCQCNLEVSEVLPGVFGVHHNPEVEHSEGQKATFNASITEHFAKAAAKAGVSVSRVKCMEGQPLLRNIALPYESARMLISAGMSMLSMARLEAGNKSTWTPEGEYLDLLTGIQMIDAARCAQSESATPVDFLTLLNSVGDALDRASANIH